MTPVSPVCVFRPRPPVVRSRASSPSRDAQQNGGEKKSVPVETKPPRIRRFVPDIQEIRVR